MKLCKVCLTEKSPQDFYSYGKTLMARCKPCHSKKVNDHKKRVNYQSPNQDFHYRSWSLKTRYGITESQYNEMLASQNNRCAICETPADKQDRLMAVDHCHKTGVIRGLLCNSCNLGIGSFRDNPRLLQGAISYLSSFVEAENEIV